MQSDFFHKPWMSLFFFSVMSLFSGGGLFAIVRLRHFQCQKSSAEQRKSHISIGPRFTDSGYRFQIFVYIMAKYPLSKFGVPLFQVCKMK